MLQTAQQALPATRRSIRPRTLRARPENALVGLSLAGRRAQTPRWHRAHFSTVTADARILTRDPFITSDVEVGMKGP
jgi:hypothetical protein